MDLGLEEEDEGIFLTEPETEENAIVWTRISPPTRFLPNASLKRPRPLSPDICQEASISKKIRVDNDQTQYPQFTMEGLGTFHQQDQSLQEIYAANAKRNGNSSAFANVNNTDGFISVQDTSFYCKNWSSVWTKMDSSRIEAVAKDPAENMEDQSFGNDTASHYGIKSFSEAIELESVGSPNYESAQIPGFVRHERTDLRRRFFRVKWSEMGKYEWIAEDDAKLHFPHLLHNYYDKMRQNFN